MSELLSASMQPSVSRTFAHKLIGTHLVDGRMESGQEIAIRIGQTHTGRNGNVGHAGVGSHGARPRADRAFCPVCGPQPHPVGRHMLSLRQVKVILAGWLINDVKAQLGPKATQ